MDRNPSLDSWSIPKRKQPPSSSTSTSMSSAPPFNPARPLDMAIPKKKTLPLPHHGRDLPTSTASTNNGNANVNDNTNLISHSRISSKGSGFPGFNPSFDNISIPRRPSSTVDSTAPMHLSSIPRKKKHSLSQDEHHHHNNNNNNNNNHFQSQGDSSNNRHNSTYNAHQVLSEFPFILQLSLKDVPLREGIQRKTFRSSNRTPKRIRQSYKEHGDSDDELFLADSDQEQSTATANTNTTASRKRLSTNKLTIKKRPKPAVSTSAATTSTSTHSRKISTGSYTSGKEASFHLGDDDEVDGNEIYDDDDDDQDSDDNLTKTPKTPTLSMDATSGIAHLALGTENPPLDTIPPPGTLHTLWYSREAFLHVFVVEKIIAWKLRPVTQLQWDPRTIHLTSHNKNENNETTGTLDHPTLTNTISITKPPNPPMLDLALAAKWSAMALTNPSVWSDPFKRMEVSRLAPEKCPVVMAMACVAQDNHGTTASPTGSNSNISQDFTTTPTSSATMTTNDNPTTNAPSIPRFRIKPTNQNIHSTSAATSLSELQTDTEEVYLVKWRGRSHLHVSWERGADIIKYDQSNNNTARHKIRRFVQSQEIAYGKDWKSVLLEQQRSANDTTTSFHITDNTSNANTNTNSNEDSNEDSNTDSNNPTSSDASPTTPLAPSSSTTHEMEEYYPPSLIEIERILACDESEMDMEFFAKQRAYNIQEEQKQLSLKESGGHAHNSKAAIRELLKEIPWDPEDNVRYVVKWKGLPFAEMTWEYWRDIKRDAVDEAEDFWIRQVPPDPETVAHLVSKPHPHIREFRKMQESPVFGLSQRKRTIASIFDNESQELSSETASSTAMEEDENMTNTGFRLRNYQLEGVNWLLFNWWNRRSCILADEMGLGKTIQSMCFLKTLQDHPATEVRGPFLIVAPLSLIGQWQSEARTWAPDLNVVLYHGSADARDFLVKQDFFYTDQFVPKQTAVKLRKQHITKFHILITTYEVVLKEVNLFSKIKWRALVVDEAHRLKNPKSKLFEDLGTVPRDFCLLLTGTPLANATEELWALLHFADKKAFADKDEFLEKFGQLTDANQVNELHSLLKPYLLRRVKEDVEKSLPPKEETILEVSLTPIQKKYYKAIYERNTAFLYKGAKPSNSPSLMNIMMELRKCCNHPYLVRGAEERILADAANQMKADTEGKEPHLDHIKIFGEQLIKSSGKMVLINKLLPKLFNNGHKVLIFSQMVRVLDLLEELLRMMKYKYERLDGSTSSSSRAAAVDRFCRKSCQRFVMLLSTRAGGLGLNLTAADIVIIFDSDWNPQNDLQAMARAHRIGQTRAVRVYRLLTAKTYEMHMFHSASMKLGLERAVLSQQRDQGDEGESGKTKTKTEKEAQAKEIDSLLKKGAYDVFKEDDDLEGQKFMETDIDQLLESNAQTVTYGKDESNLSSGLGSFSKASFVADTGDGEKDVDLDDPDFWRKAAGLEAPIETPEEVAQMLDDGVKRSRKQVQVFDPFADFAALEQKKEDKKMQKIREEKEEKERVRIEKKMQKIVEKEKKRKDKGDTSGGLFGKSKIPISGPKPDAKFKIKKKEPLPLPTMKKDLKTMKHIKAVKEGKSKKPKRSGERKRALKRMQNEDPMIERLKQAWDVPQRNRAVAACLRFGFGRFCKIRSESNLTSLPIQDLEVFFRSYFYQLCLQLVVAFLQVLKEETTSVKEENLQDFLKVSLGLSGSKELNWLCDCISNGMKLYLDIDTSRRFLRLPMILAEPAFVSELRRGAALRSLRRLFILGRLSRIVENCLDDIIAELGYEQLGKRGCPTSSFSSMDADLKARLVSTEELSLALSTQLGQIRLKPPVAWWDRSCDIALIIGTFVHGLGNYDAMLNDESLPFLFNIRRFAKSDEACSDAQKLFYAATKAVRSVFHDALEAAKIKDQMQIQAAVAAAAATSKEREQDALALREGGEAADAVTQVVHETPADKLYDTEGDDSHFVTLPRLKTKLSERLHSDQIELDAVLSAQPQTIDDGGLSEEKVSGRRRSNIQHPLAMPDARILDYRLRLLLEKIEDKVYPDESVQAVEINPMVEKLWPSSRDVVINNSIKARAVSQLLGESACELQCHSFECIGIGINGTQCGSTHRSLDSGSDYFAGSASGDLAQVAYGSDSPRFLRAIGVPMNLTRFAVAAIVHADGPCVERLLETEKARNALSKAEAENTLSMSSIKEESKNLMTSTSEGTDSPPQDGAVQMDAVADTPTTLHPEDAPTQPQPIIPKRFADCSRLRASICAVVLHYGSPFKHGNSATVFKPLWDSVREHCATFDEMPPDSLFGAERFLSLVLTVAGDGIEPIDFDVCHKYVMDFLLPHCLRLCLTGNGPVLENARGSKGEYTTALGISLYQEPTDCLQCTLPDPCLPLEEHSVEALASAFAILRRTQLMRCAMELATGKLPLKRLEAALHSSFLRKSMEGLPIWWCPWIHDAALLVHATTRGLFSIVKDRKNPETAPLAFSQETIRQHLYSTFITDDSALPRPIVEHTHDDNQDWIEHHAKEFPSMNILERRLAFLCAKATEGQGDGMARYDNLPMFDHGAWPRN